MKLKFWQWTTAVCGALFALDIMFLVWGPCL